MTSTLRPVRRGIATVALATTILLAVTAPATATPIGVPPLGAVAQVVAWGADDDGQGSVPASLAATLVRAVAAGANHNLVLTKDRTVVAWGADDDGQATVPATLEDQTVKAIAAAGDHSLALTTKGSVVAWGDDQYGQSTVPTSLTGETVTAIAAGPSHSLALTATGHVVAWGDDRAGQSTVPVTLDDQTVTAVAGGTTHSLALLADGTVVGWGDNTAGELDPPPLLSGLTVTSIAAGDQGSVAVTDTGVVIAWGDNSDDQTTVPFAIGNNGSVLAAADHTNMAVTVTGRVYSWGRETAASTVPSALSDRYVQTVAVGTRHAIAIVEPAVKIYSGPPPETVRAGDRYFFHMLATGNPQPTFRLGTGRLPDGLKLDGDGQLMGRPTEAGTFTFTAIADNHVDPAFTSDPWTIVVSPGSPVSVTAVSGDGQSAATDRTFDDPLVAVVADAYGNPRTGVDVEFSLPAAAPGSGTARFAGGGLTTTVTSDDDGLVTSPKVVAGSAAGPVTASAVFPAAGEPATWTLTVTGGGSASEADLSVGLHAPASAKVRHPVRLTLAVRNAGPTTAEEVVTRVRIPAGWTVSDPGNGTVASKTLVIFRVAALPAAGGARSHLTVVSGPHHGATQLRARTKSATPDPHHGDNVDREQVRLH